MKHGYRSTSSIVPYFIGLVWAYAGIGKLVSMALSPDDVDTTTWAAQFDPNLMLAITILEVVVALVIFAGKLRSGLIAGLFMLSCFLTAVILFPQTQGQPCGCFGESTDLSSISILARIVVFVGIHALGLSMIWAINSDTNQHHAGLSQAR